MSGYGHNSGAPPLRLLDLFSGIGGFSLGLERAGFRTVAFCDNNPKCRHLLKHHWPEVPVYDDVITLTAERLAADGICVDAICGGFPCQDVSYAGPGAGITGKRSGLYVEYIRLIRELRPRVVIMENVSALLGRGLGAVLGDLAALGYDAEWDCIRAADVGAPHLRDRVWIVAYPRGEQHEGFGDAFRRALAAELARAYAVNTSLCAWDDGEADAFDPDADRFGRDRAEIDQLGDAEFRDQQDGIAGPMGGVLADTDIDPRHERRLGDAGQGQGGRDADRGAEREDVADASRIAEREPSDQAVAVAVGGETRDEFGRGGEHVADTSGEGFPKPERGALRGAWRGKEGRATTECGGRPTQSDMGGMADAFPPWLDGLSGDLQEAQGWWAAEPEGVPRVAQGVPARVDSLHGLGNAVVWDIPYCLGRAILTAMETRP